MFSLKSNACLLVAAFAFHAACFAQSSAVLGAGAAYPGNPDSTDMRVGAIRGEAAGPITDGGTRAGSAGPSAAPAASSGRDYRVGPNDLIDVEIYDLDNLKRTVRVNAAGSISLPLVGQVAVAGLTSQEVEERIAGRYREKYLQNPQVSIFIKEFTTERITVEGAVVKPGMFPLTGQITLLRALAMAGGFGPIANTSEVMLFRVNEQRKREGAVYDVEKIRAGKIDDPVIRGDDLIVVQRDSARVIFKDSIFRDIVDSINPFTAFMPR